MGALSTLYQWSAYFTPIITLNLENRPTWDLLGDRNPTPKARLNFLLNLRMAIIGHQLLGFFLGLIS